MIWTVIRKLLINKPFTENKKLRNGIDVLFENLAEIQFIEESIQDERDAVFDAEFDAEY